MNAEQVEILGTLRLRMKELMRMYEEEKSEKETLKEENVELTRRIAIKEKLIDELEHKYDTLKMARSLVEGEDIHDAKIKVNRIVREIDKCIALLNR